MAADSPLAVALPSPFALDVAAGLGGRGQKTLPCKYFYDELGSALFEAITALPEYTITRAEERVLQTHAETIAARSGARTVVELGSGSSRKTRRLLECLARRQATRYVPIDISPAALAASTAALDGLARLVVQPLAAEYLDGMRHIAAARADAAPLLLLFLGSSLGNFGRRDGIRFLRRLRRALRRGDRLLLGTDLLKPAPVLLAAYDDALGVTAAFNRNLLARANRELGADFVPARFRHEARFDPRGGGIEMHLVAREAHSVRVPAAGLRVAFAAGESIHTESCHKYSLPEVAHLGACSGFACEGQWIDREGAFADTLFVAV